MRPRQALDRVRGEFELIPEVELVAELGTSPVPVLTDPDRLQQVFVNLLTNAAKFTSKGQVRLTVTAYATEALVCVSDTGVGIPPDRIESVFDMFHTTACPDTKNDAHRGTGLGLAICMRIVEHYGGCVWVESELAEGSRFYFNMPISQALTAELRLPLH